MSPRDIGGSLGSKAALQGVTLSEECAVGFAAAIAGNLTTDR